MVYEHDHLKPLLLLNSTFILSVVKMPLIAMEIKLFIMENHGIVFLNFCGNPREEEIISDAIDPQGWMCHHASSTWVKVFRINPEFRILRLTFHIP